MERRGRRMSDGQYFRQRRLKSWWLVIWHACVILARDRWQSLITSKTSKRLTECVIPGFSFLVLLLFKCNFHLLRWEVIMSLCVSLCVLVLQFVSFLLFSSSFFCFLNWWTCSNTLAIASGVALGSAVPFTGWLIHPAENTGCISVFLCRSPFLFNWCLRYFSDS